ncbi:MAG: lysophospholipid acyltransferase family protein [Planctomycetaceae bacterium]|jgi:Kdo2-lipid IVA lauroyltransferase/acyltransferase|nr:lysophospholipid acyltransferase family protein [Planctomycetaceae bacterium]MBT6847738.1 lysophospholipid acyltransferase family protein [Planctomycetaceae bacterium]
MIERFALLLAWLGNDVFRIRRAVIVENLSAVYPQLDATQRIDLARQMWQSLALMCCEIAQAPRRINRYSWRSFIQLSKLDSLVAALLDQRPTILLSGHFGNFEVAGFAAGLFGFPSFTIARPLDNSKLNTFFNTFRGMHGQFILPKRGVADQVTDLLESGATLTVLGDQADSLSGIELDFLGRNATCHKAIALYALNSNCNMVVATAVRQSRYMNFALTCNDVLDIPQLEKTQRSIRNVTQWYNRQLESAIRRAPHQYWWLHRRWKAKRKRRRRDNKGD